jgi:tight adherence protein B
MSVTFLIIAWVIILILLVVGVVMTSNSERNLVEDRLGRYLDENDGQGGQKGDNTYVTEWVNKKVEKSSSGDKVKRSLARADLKLKVAEYYALILIAAVGVGLLAAIIGGGEFLQQAITFGVGALIGSFLPSMYVRRQQSVRLKRFDNQLADMINLMVNGLRAGYSTMQALEAVSRELPPPISDEFRRVVQEMQLGVPMDTALDNLLRRIPSPDLDFMITAMNVQREVGGNLAEILDTISFTIRERIRIKGEVTTLTAQVTASAKILSFIPIGLFVLLWFISNDYISSIFDNGLGCGLSAIGTGLFLIGIGYFVMMKIADIEI